MNDNLSPGVTDADIDMQFGDDFAIESELEDMDDDSDLTDIVV